jgi:hypothetical protein
MLLPSFPSTHISTEPPPPPPPGGGVEVILWFITVSNRPEGLIDCLHPPPDGLESDVMRRRDTSPRQSRVVSSSKSKHRRGACWPRTTSLSMQLLASQRCKKQPKVPVTAAMLCVRRILSAFACVISSPHLPAVQSFPSTRIQRNCRGGGGGQTCSGPVLMPINNYRTLRKHDIRLLARGWPATAITGQPRVPEPPTTSSSSSAIKLLTAH